MKRIILPLVAVLALTACGKPGERARFNGNYYPAKLSQTGDRPETFVVTVQGVGQGIDGAREAGRFEATGYCVRTYGDSDIAWQAGYDPDAGAAVAENGTLILRGNCAIW